MIKKVLFIVCLIYFGIQFSFAQTINLALNKPTEQSTTINSKNSNLVVDGNTNGIYSFGSVSETSNEANSWWQVDLQANFDISLIKLYNRTDAFQERLANFYVFISETDLSGRNFSDIMSDCTVTSIYVKDAVGIDLPISKAASGRFVRIQLASTNVLSLAEVAIYEEVGSNLDCNNFCLLDDFDTYLNGSVRGQGNWQTNPPGATDGAIISSEAGDGFLGKSLMNDPNGVEFRGNAYLPLNDLSIPENEEGTLFFQISGDDLLNTNSYFGLTDLASPSLIDEDIESSNDYKVQLSIEYGNFNIYNGVTKTPLINIVISDGVVYNVWITIDNLNDTFEVYIQGGVHTLPLKGVSSIGTSSFEFRNTTNLSLQTLYLINSPDNVETGVVYYDSFYVDKQNQNLNIPIDVSQTFSFIPVDNFENQNLGELNNQNEWVSNSNSTIISADPDNSNNQILTISSGSMNAYKPLTNIIRNCETGTVFYRIKRNSVVNESIGLSDVTMPTEFSDYENQINFNNDDELNARNGNEFLSVAEIDNNQWYCVWMVINNTTDTYNLYIQGAGDNEPNLLSSGSQSDFNFRNGSSTNALTTFFIKQNNSIGSFSIDDIYIDPSQENLSLPARGLDDFDDVVIDNSSPLDDPIPGSIVTNDVGVVLEEFVTIPASDSNDPLARINFLGHANETNGRLFVNDLRNSLYAIENKTVTVYLDVSAQFNNFADAPRLGSGFGFFAFHPEFATNGKFYTVHTESGSALNSTPDFTSFGTDDMHGVITEWTATDPEAKTFSGTKREVLRIGFDTALHGFQQIGFNPTVTKDNPDYGLLYLALGDGEENPVFSGAPQDLAVPHGKILRINPLGNNSSNGNYGIPSSNPFINDNGALDEIWAYGFRNPHRFSWDLAGTHKMFIGNIGEKNIDAIYLGEIGENYGWNEREGSFLFNTEDPNNVYPLPENDAINNYKYPVAQYDHDEGFAIVGGFVYRGNNVSSLSGKYVFGDIVKGRIFYSEESEMTNDNQFTQIHELILYDEDEKTTSFLDLINDSRADLRFGMDHEGEIYALSKRNGKIYKMRELSGTASTTDFDTPQMVVYPNPVKDNLYINFQNKHTGTIKLTVFNLLGHKLKTYNYTVATKYINVSSLSRGVYFLKGEIENNFFVKKFVKE